MLIGAVLVAVVVAATLGRIDAVPANAIAPIDIESPDEPVVLPKSEDEIETEDDADDGGAAGGGGGDPPGAPTATPRDEEDDGHEATGGGGNDRPRGGDSDDGDS